MTLQILNEIFIASGYENGRIYIWNINTSLKVASLTCFSDPILCMHLYSIGDGFRGFVAGAQSNIMSIEFILVYFLDF